MARRALLLSLKKSARMPFKSQLRKISRKQQKVANLLILVKGFLSKLWVPVSFH